MASFLNVYFLQNSQKASDDFRSVLFGRTMYSFLGVLTSLILSVFTRSAHAARPARNRGCLGEAAMSSGRVPRGVIHAIEDARSGRYAHRGAPAGAARLSLPSIGSDSAGTLHRELPVVHEIFDAEFRLPVREREPWKVQAKDHALVGGLRFPWKHRRRTGSAFVGGKWPIIL